MLKLLQDNPDNSQTEIAEMMNLRRAGPPMPRTGRYFGVKWFKRYAIGCLIALLRARMDTRGRVKTRV